MESKTLFIITTHETPNGNNPSNGFFFLERNKYKPKKLNYKLEDLKNFFENEEMQIWYRIDGNNGMAFGHIAHPLNKTINQKEYLRSLCREVAVQLPPKAKASFDEIIFLLHSGELGVEFGFKKLDDLDEYIIHIWNEIAGNVPKIKVIAFRHEPQFAFYRLLRTSKSWASVSGDPIDKLKNVVEKSLAILPITQAEKESKFEWQDEEIKNQISNYLESFNIDILMPIVQDGRPKLWAFESEGVTQAEKKAVKEFKDSIFGNIVQKINGHAKKGGNHLRIILLPVGFLEDDRIDGLIKELYPEQNKKWVQFPDLFIGFYDLMNDQNEEREWIDARFRFFDSSILRRYAPLNDGGNKLLNALKTITWAWNHHLYNKNVSKEYNEFIVRLFKNAYLDKNQGDGHSSYVKPFIFHSESLMEEVANNLANKLRENKLKWNFLFIDDYCQNILKEGNQIPDPGNGQITKKDLVIEIIEEDKFDVLEQKDAKFKFCDKFQPETSIESAQKKFTSASEDIFDIILLDYLFSFNQKEGEVHFGTELFTFFEENISDLHNKGPLQKYWIFPATAFPEAMHSAFQGNSIQHLEKNWQLARGADPVNTPFLFRCALLEFMKAQMESLLFSEAELWKFLLDNQPPKPIREPSKKQSDEFLRWANDTFRKFLYRFSSIEGLSNKSGLGKAIQDRINDGDELSRAYKLMERLRQIFYLLAYSTGFDAEPLRKDMDMVIELFDTTDEFIFKNQSIDIAKLKKALERIATYVYSASYKFF